MTNELLVLLSRIQFGLTITFHILFPAFSIGLITFIAVFEGIWLRTKNPFYFNICRFWTNVLALTFGMGIVSGIVMEFQLGTNWSHYTEASGNVLGVLFSYEVLTAFFIEAGFLGVMFFGWNRVRPSLHFVATLLALFGVTLSAFWILSANSWMQYPAGVAYENGIFSVTSWHDVIFNPMFLPRFFHMLVATYISALLVIMAVSASYILKAKHLDFAHTCFKAALKGLIILVPLQFLIGDTVGLKVHQYQPIKTAAIEGVWETQKGAPLLLFAIPDKTAEKNYFEIGIPKLASIINTHQIDGELVGLKSVAATDRPPVPNVFFSFRVMVGLWAVMFLLVSTGFILLLRNNIFNHPWFLRAAVVCAPIGFISIITGWFTAEFGRQPWIIYQFLRTTDAHSDISIYHVMISLFLIVLVYGIVFGYFYFRYLFKMINTGPIAETASANRTFNYLSTNSDLNQP